MKAAVLLVAAFVAACGGASQVRDAKRYELTGQNPFRFEVERELLREWGGPDSARFNQVLEEELERRRICRNGYVLRNDGLREGVYTVTGRCKS